MPFVAVFVFRQKMRETDVESVLTDIPAIFNKVAQSRGDDFDPERVSVVLIDGAARNVFSPESHAKGFQGLDILFLVFAKIPDQQHADLLRESLESQFRERWVTRARIFAADDAHWKVGRWADDNAVLWDLGES